MPKHLHVVVPCSKSAATGALVDQMAAYFERNSTSDKAVYLMTFVCQEGPTQPNLAALKNAGFLLGMRHSDYTCFNEREFLPVWVDYSWSEVPVALAWHDLSTGTHDGTPVSPTLRAIRENLGVLLTPNEVHLRVDGYSNGYVSGASSSHDLRGRYREAGIAVQQRLGTFLVQGVAPQTLELNRERLAAEADVTADRPRDGLSTLAFQIVDRRAMTSHAIRGQVVTVKFGSELNVPTEAAVSSDEGPHPDRLTRMLQKWLVSAASKHR